MKIRSGFVSNSSSSSFMISKKGLPEDKLEMFRYIFGLDSIYSSISDERLLTILAVDKDPYIELAKEDWDIIEKSDGFYFYTDMDNIKLPDYLNSKYDCDILYT